MTQREVRFGYPVLVLLIVLALGFALRLEAVAQTTVIDPVRADAKEYFLYAYNLRHHGVYSGTNTLSADATPVPDARRVPLYPLFLAPFISNPPVRDNLAAIVHAQALIGTLAIVLVFLLARRILPLPFALGATALTAISPHLVSMNVYLLTETLFGALLVLALYLLVRGLQEGHVLGLGLPGAALAAAALTHPLVQYLLLPLAFYVVAVYPRPARWKAAAALVLGFALVQGPWVARNLDALDTPGDSSLLVDTLHHGMYPDMMYQGDPATWRSPYLADPRSAEIARDLPTVAAEIARNVREAPGEYARWYLLGKPMSAWSWDIIVGRGDVFVYRTAGSPYAYRPHFQATHWLMRHLHWPLVVLMALAALLVWLPRTLTGLTFPVALAARAVSMLILYHTAVMVAGFPLPRYAVPLRPFTYLMAMLSIFVFSRFLGGRQANATA